MKKILIIDDEEDFAVMVKRNLEFEGKYEVTVETDGLKGHARAKGLHPDLILLDLMMPQIDGTEVARRIKADASLRDIPVVFLTAAVRKEEVSSQPDGVIGGYVFVAKPVETKDLIDVIENNIART